MADPFGVNRLRLTPLQGRGCGPSIIEGVDHQVVGGAAYQGPAPLGWGALNSLPPFCYELLPIPLLHLT